MVGHLIPYFKDFTFLASCLSSFRICVPLAGFLGFWGFFYTLPVFVFVFVFDHLMCCEKKPQLTLWSWAIYFAPLRGACCLSFRFPDGLSLSSKLFRFSFWGFMFFILPPVRIVYQQGGSVAVLLCK